MIWGFVISLLFLRSFLVSGRRRQDTGSVWVCWSSRACVWMCATRRDAPCSTWPLRRDTVAVWSCCSANQHPACSRSAVISGVLSMSQVNSTTFCCFVNIRGGGLIFISMPFTVHFVMFWSRLGPRGRRAVSLSCIEMVTCFVWARCNTCLVYYHDYFHLTKGGVCVCLCLCLSCQWTHRLSADAALQRGGHWPSKCLGHRGTVSEQRLALFLSSSTASDQSYACLRSKITLSWLMTVQMEKRLKKLQTFVRLLVMMRGLL